MRVIRFLLLVMAVISCGVDTPSDPPPATPPAEPSRDAKLRRTAYLLVQTFNTLYNQNLVGRSPGAVHQVLPCPISGSARYDGTIYTSALGGGEVSTSSDLNIGFSDCTVSSGLGTLSFFAPAGTAATGSHRGNWTSLSGTLKSQNATIAGYAHLQGQVAFAGKSYEIDEQNCRFSVTQVLDDPINDKWSTSGTVCGIAIHDRD